MAAKKDKKRRPGKAGAVELNERDLDESELDQIQGGASRQRILKASSDGPKAPNKSAVGMHEITGALIKIN